MDTIISSLYEYFKTCPLLAKSSFNVDYLPASSVGYAISARPENQFLKQYVDGSSLHLYLFSLWSINNYGAEISNNLAANKFFEDLAQWMKKQTEQGNLPILPEGMKAQSVSAQGNGNLVETSAETGKYQIQCQLQYFQGVN